MARKTLGNARPPCVWSSEDVPDWLEYQWGLAAANRVSCVRPIVLVVGSGEGTKWIVATEGRFDKRSGPVSPSKQKMEGLRESVDTLLWLCRSQLIKR